MMITEEEKKKKETPKWNKIQTGENVSSGTSTSRVNIDMDTTGWNDPTKYDFKRPEKKEYKYNPDEGFLSAFGPKEPVYDYDREERLNRVARVNAFGDFAKHLGALAGSGYAPTEKREENKEVLRAFSELDRLRDVYDAKRERYNDNVLSLRIHDDANQRAKHERDYEHEYGEKKSAYDINYKTQEDLRRLKSEAAIKNATTQVNRQNGVTDQYENLDLLMAEQDAKKKAGSGKDESFTAYKQGVGDIKISKDATIQIGTRIKDAMLRAGRISEKDAAGLMAALGGGNSRTAFQSMLDYLKYDDVWNECKQFLGHGMEVMRSNGSPASKPGGGDSNAGVVDVSNFFK